ncbi:MAG: hypothetical protein ACR2QK_16980 [Acidimicrobiales bacterium]
MTLLGAFDATAAELGTLHVVGGRQRNRQGLRELDEQWYGYGKGVVVEVAGGTPTTVLERRCAEGTVGPDDPELFKSATRHGDRLYACSETEVLVYSYPDLELLHHVSHPIFNDVHHVVPAAVPADRSAPSPGSVGVEPNLVVAVSGQDLVAELTVEGELVSMWAVDGSDPSKRIDPDRDYRVNTRLKPHAYHPNHLFRMADGRLWVTRFESRDAVEVGNLDRRMVIGRERCHDGVLHDGLVHFTTVDGWVVAIDADTLEVVAEHRLAGPRESTLLGWCRGLTFVGDLAIVGFSRIRHTKVRGALSWVRNGLTVSEPTRIAVYDRHSWSLQSEIDLEPAGCNAVFSIIAGTEAC